VFIDPGMIIVDAALLAAANVVVEGIRVAVQRCAPPGMVSGLSVVPGSLGAAACLQGAVSVARRENLWTYAERRRPPGPRPEPARAGRTTVTSTKD
jgi:hypothetical protein